MPKQTFHIQNIPVSIGYTPLAHMLNWHTLCIHKIHSLIFSMQEFRYWLCISIFDSFGHVVSPL